MADWTAGELATAVLKELGVVGAGQTASAEDSGEVTVRWTSIHAQLRKEGLANFGDGASTAEIPDWAQEPLVKHVAGKCAALFGHRDQGSIVIFEGARQGYIDLQIQHHGGKKHIRTRTKGY